MGAQHNILEQISNGPVAVDDLIVVVAWRRQRSAECRAPSAVATLLFETANLIGALGAECVRTRARVRSHTTRARRPKLAHSIRFRALV